MGRNTNRLKSSFSEAATCNELIGICLDIHKKNAQSQSTNSSKNDKICYDKTIIIGKIIANHSLEEEMASRDDTLFFFL